VNVTYHLAHFPPAVETVQVGSSNSTPLAFSALATTTSGATWLSVSPTAGTTPATINLSFSVSGMTPGVYQGTVTLASGGITQAAIGVTLTVVADTGIVLQAAPASLTFTSTGTAPAAQNVQVSAGTDAVIFLADISTSNNGKWLSVTPTGAATPATLSVSVDPKNLTPATYTGTISLHLSGLTNVAQTIPVTFTIGSAPTLPAINTNGVLNAGSLAAAIAPGTWVSIFGTALSPTTRSWNGTDFTGGKLPMSLDNVSVTIDGKPAAVSYISSTQINVLAPDAASTGLVFAQVKTPAGTSSNALVLQQTAAPAFFPLRAANTNYVAGTHADNSLLAGTALNQQGLTGTPAKPGETIVLYGTGFGATQPAISATALVTSPMPLANPQDLRVRIGGVDAQVVFAGLVSPGLYQFNVIVPNVPDGDQTVVAELRGLATQTGLWVPVQR
jgi:uncharacterized protein (TIGR03437 family)